MTDPVPAPKDSKLVVHAQDELIALGEDDATIQGYLTAIRALEQIDGPLDTIRDVLNDLLSWKNLTSLTTDPTEWNKVGPKTWLSYRNPDAISKDGGKTYFLLSEGFVTHDSEEYTPPVPPTA